MDPPESVLAGTQDPLLKGDVPTKQKPQSRSFTHSVHRLKVKMRSVFSFVLAVSCPLCAMHISCMCVM